MNSYADGQLPTALEFRWKSRFRLVGFEYLHFDEHVPLPNIYMQTPSRFENRKMLITEDQRQKCVRKLQIPDVRKR